jgi:hypothetical protein
LWILVIAIFIAFSVRRVACAQLKRRLQQVIVAYVKTVLPFHFHPEKSLELLHARQSRIPLKLIRPRIVSNTKVALDPIVVVPIQLPVPKYADSAVGARSCLHQTVL